jgi:predicted RNA polymerase sigma factor
VQEGLLAAATQWPEDSIPDDPRGWLITVASRRLTDLLRSEQARQRREDTVARWILPDQWLAPAADRLTSASPESDDTLILLFLCCHPSLSPASQIARTLRAVGGLTTAEIARAFLVLLGPADAPGLHQGQRYSLRHAPGPVRTERLGAVLHVLYLIVNEGYASTSGPSLQRSELAAEAPASPDGPPLAAC